MKIRRDWTLADYREWEEGCAVDAAMGDGPSLGYSGFNRNSVEKYREYMEEALYDTYDKALLKECIEDEEEYET